MRFIVRPVRRGEWTNRRSRRTHQSVKRLGPSQLAKFRPGLAHFCPESFRLCPQRPFATPEVEGPTHQTIALVDDDQNI